jgi:nitroimidazol reductase NimA-like FMN-containing flavoprotein (pyridoxamine 5'-phosphate oxidase superfamily)
MNAQELEEFLSRPLIARIATLKDGGPYINPVWFLYEHGDILIVARRKAQYVFNILKDARVAVLVDNPSLPYSRVLLEGEAKIVERDWVPIHLKQAEKYFGDLKKARSYIETTKEQTRCVIKVSPHRITSWKDTAVEDGLPAWHPRYYEPGTRLHDLAKAARS